MKFFLQFTFLLFSSCLFAQNGPGGVGSTDGTSDLTLWLVADKETVTAGTVTTWTDQSGYGNNFTEGTAGTIATSTVNGYQSFNFDGTTHYFETPHVANLTTTDFSIFTTLNVTSSASKKTIVSNIEYPAPGNYNQGYEISVSDNNDDFWHLDYGNNTGYGGLGYFESSPNVWTGLFAQNKVGTGMNFLFNSVPVVGSNANESIGSTESIQVGSNFGWNGTASVYKEFFKGEISEVIIYKTAINKSQQIIVDNYLAAKYGYSLPNYYYPPPTYAPAPGFERYTQDDSAPGNFDHNVAGIGQADDGSNHFNSKGTGIVRVHTPVNFTNGEYFFWGEESKNATYDFSTEGYAERLNSKWRVNMISDYNNNVDISVKASDLILTGMIACANLKLVLSDDNFSSVNHSYDMSFDSGSGEWTATGVYFNDGDYFTFEYFDTIVLDVNGFHNGSQTGNAPANWNECYSFLVKGDANGAFVLPDDAKVKDLTIELNGLLVVAAGKKLEVIEGVDMEGDIRLLSASQLLQTGLNGVVGSGKLYQEIQGNQRNIYQSSLWSSPVSTGTNTYTINGAMKDGTTALSATSTHPDFTFVTGHDGSNAPTISEFWLAKLTNALAWNQHGNEDEVNNITEGFNMKGTGVTGGQNFVFIGTPNSGDYTSTIASGNSSLLGNPYPSAMNADTFLSNNYGLFTALHFWDETNSTQTNHNSSSYDGGYATRNLIASTPAPTFDGTAFNSGTMPTDIIPVGQGFFVDATGTGNIVFNNGQRVFGTGSFYNKTPMALLRIGFEFDINNNTYHRQVAVGFNGTTNGFEPAYDALMYDMHATDMALKVANHSGDFVICGTESFVDTIELPLHIKLEEQRNVTFNIDAIENFSPNAIFLKDNTNGMYYDLSNPVSMNLEIGDFTDRFSIVFRSSPLAIEEAEMDTNITLIDKGNSIKIESDELMKRIAVYNVIGQLLTENNINSESATMDANFEKGQVLLVNITLESGVVITKKIIKN
ncbi:MAG: hypothetical protein V3U80_04770 [Flavobacteriaceae bacterium]